MVLVHGSSGIALREDRWAGEIRLAGAATFFLDSFTSRAIASTFEDQSQLCSLAMIGDAYRALELRATHPRIDPAPIAVMGFSKGAIGALYSALTRFQRLHGPAGGARFAHHIAFHPACYYTFVGDLAVSASPIRLLHGMADDLAPIEHRRAYVPDSGKPAPTRRSRSSRGPPRVRSSGRCDTAAQPERAEWQPVLLGGATRGPLREPVERAAVQRRRPVHDSGRDLWLRSGRLRRGAPGGEGPRRDAIRIAYPPSQRGRTSCHRRVVSQCDRAPGLTRLGAPCQAEFMPPAIPGPESIICADCGQPITACACGEEPAPTPTPDPPGR